MRKELFFYKEKNPTLQFPTNLDNKSQKTLLILSRLVKGQNRIELDLICLRKVSLIKKFKINQ